MQHFCDEETFIKIVIWVGEETQVDTILYFNVSMSKLRLTSLSKSVELRWISVNFMWHANLLCIGDNSGERFDYETNGKNLNLILKNKQSNCTYHGTEDCGVIKATANFMYRGLYSFEYAIQFFWRSPHYNSFSMTTSF